MNPNPLISFIVPVYKTEGYLAQLLKSIAEQDYVNIEVIVVFDGESKRGQELLPEIRKKYPNLDIKDYTIEHGGAPKARNFGFKKSRGDIISFMDSDCLLAAGTVRDWVDCFEEKPDISFIYEGYKLMNENLEPLPSREFDPYLLTVNNYIASMFPLKREAVVEWDESLKGLQDWDFWLRVVKNGHKGWFRRDYHLFTRPSYKGDKSITSGTVDNWLERMDSVKQKNGIPDRKICVSTLGAFYQSIQRAKVLDADYREFPGDKPHKYKMILTQGFYPFNVFGQLGIYQNAPKECLKVIHWIGTDVWQMTQLKWETVVQLIEKLNTLIDVHLCNSIWLQKELKKLGIRAHLVYQPVDVDSFPVAIEKKVGKTVAVYYTDSNKIHNIDYLIDIAQSMPDVHWILFGGSLSNRELGGVPSKNITCMKWIDVNDVIKQSDLLLRLPEHDGFSHCVVQFLVAGKKVVCNTPVPYAHYVDIKPNPDVWAKQKADLIEVIRKQLKDKFSPETISQIREYYKSIADPQLYRSIIYDILEKGKRWVPYDYDREESEIEST